jgi:hypothetical protein
VKKVLIVLSLAAMLSVSFAAMAQARGKVLSGKRAAAVTKLVAERNCNRDPDCLRYGAANCRRQAMRRVSCLAITQGTDASGNYQCERRVLVRLISRTGDVKYATGDRQCFRS